MYICATYVGLVLKNSGTAGALLFALTCRPCGRTSELSWENDETNRDPRFESQVYIPWTPVFFISFIYIYRQSQERHEVLGSLV